MGRKSPSEREKKKRKCNELTVLRMQERNVRERLPESKGALLGLSTALRRGPHRGKKQRLNHQTGEAPE